MNTLSDDEALRPLFGRVITDGLYVLCHGVQNLPTQPDVDLQTPYVIACTQEQASALFNDGILEGKLYNIEGRADITGLMSGEEVSFQNHSTQEQYQASLLAAGLYEGKWKGPTLEGTWTLELAIQREL